MIINLPKCVNVPPLIPLEVTKSLLRNERTPNEYPLLNITLIVGATIHLISLLICQQFFLEIKMRALEINFKESIFLIYKIHTCEHLEFVNFVWVLINVPVYSVVINLDSGRFFLLLNILGIYIISSYSFYNLSDPVWHSLPCVCLHIERLKKIFQLNIIK